jgi:hypothetical protein
MANFMPVTTLSDLDALDQSEMLQGYKSAERGDPEPGANRGRAWSRHKMTGQGHDPQPTPAQEGACDQFQSRILRGEK